jgi:tryptophan-rich sensory protein
LNKQQKYLQETHIILPIIVFGVLNFAALGIGGMLTSSGVVSEWYAELNKAPWTPPGWVFGAAWTTIMLAFAVFMGFLWSKTKIRRGVFLIYAFQWLLNVGWNAVFFGNHNVLLGQIVIFLLLVLVGVYLFGFWKVLRFQSLLIAPYFIWLIIANSLNAYILFMN